MARLKGDLETAANSMMEAQTFYVGAADFGGILLTLQERCMLAIAKGQMDHAVRLWGAAASLRDEIGLRMSPNDHMGYDPMLAQARSVLSEAEFDAAFHAGRELTCQEALALRT